MLRATEIIARGDMADPVNIDASRGQLVCSLPDSSDGNASETNTGRANIDQPVCWAPSVPVDKSGGARALPAAGSDNVCKLEYCLLPPVCVLDDETSAAEAARARATEAARARANACPETNNMPDCPPYLQDYAPAGWKEYDGKPVVFHCGLRGMVADCSPDGDHLQQECFYDEAGALVDDSSIDRLCAGTPNADDAKEHPIWHIFTKGGIIRSGWDGLYGSFLHFDREASDQFDQANFPVPENER